MPIQHNANIAMDINHNQAENNSNAIESNRDKFINNQNNYNKNINFRVATNQKTKT